MDFSGNVVLVTGASRGLGRAIAVQFAYHNAGVAVHYYQDSDRQDAEQTLASMKDGMHGLFQADLTDPESISCLVDDVVHKMGRIHVLVNNAGVYDEHPIDCVNYSEWQESWKLVLGTNLLGTANVIYYVVQHMIDRGGGRIINITSRGAFRGEPKAPAYGASKAGLNALSQSMAKALAPHNIFVYAVAPGLMETEMVAYRLEGALGEAVRKESPLGRVGQPEEVARAVLFLASEGIDYLTGCIIDANGASYLRT